MTQEITLPPLPFVLAAFATSEKAHTPLNQVVCNYAIAAVEANRQTIIEQFLSETGQYVTNDATRKAEIDAAVALALQGRGEAVAFAKDGVLFWHGDHAAWRGFNGNLYLAAPQPAEPNEWKCAVDDELTTIQSTADSYPSAKEAVNALIDWHVGVATDPALQQSAEPVIDYQALYEQMCERCDALDAKLAEYSERQAEPVKGLSDDEITEVWMHSPQGGTLGTQIIGFARALLARYGSAQSAIPSNSGELEQPAMSASVALAHELSGVVVDVEMGGGFDSVCLDTIKRVRDILLSQPDERTPGQKRLAKLSTDSKKAAALERARHRIADAIESSITDLPARLRMKADIMTMGERIEWGSDTELMYEAADALERCAAPEVTPKGDK